MAHRRFNDDAGTEWDVHDVTVPADSPRPGTPVPGVTTGIQPLIQSWLCFESETEKRRLGPIPQEYLTVTEDGLRELLSVAAQGSKGSR